MWSQPLVFAFLWATSSAETSHGVFSISSSNEVTQSSGESVYDVTINMSLGSIGTVAGDVTLLSFSRGTFASSEPFLIYAGNNNGSQTICATCIPDGNIAKCMLGAMPMSMTNAVFTIQVLGKRGQPPILTSSMQYLAKRTFSCLGRTWCEHGDPPKVQLPPPEINSFLRTLSSFSSSSTTFFAATSASTVSHGQAQNENHLHKISHSSSWTSTSYTTSSSYFFASLSTSTRRPMHDAEYKLDRLLDLFLTLNQPSLWHLPPPPSSIKPNSAAISFVEASSFFTTSSSYLYYTSYSRSSDQSKKKPFVAPYTLSTTSPSEFLVTTLLFLSTVPDLSLSWTTSYSSSSSSSKSSFLFASSSSHSYATSASGHTISSFTTALSQIARTSGVLDLLKTASRSHEKSSQKERSYVTISRARTSALSQLSNTDVVGSYSTRTAKSIQVFKLLNCDKVTTNKIANDYKLTLQFSLDDKKINIGSTFDLQIPNANVLKTKAFVLKGPDGKACARCEPTKQKINCVVIDRGTVAATGTVIIDVKSDNEFNFANWKQNYHPAPSAGAKLASPVATKCEQVTITRTAACLTTSTLYVLRMNTGASNSIFTTTVTKLVKLGPKECPLLHESSSLGPGHITERSSSTVTKVSYSTIELVVTSATTSRIFALTTLSFGNSAGSSTLFVSIPTLSVNSFNTRARLDKRAKMKIKPAWYVRFIRIFGIFLG